MIAEGRVGFLMTERLVGTHTYSRDYPPGQVTAGTELPLSLELTWGGRRVARFLNPLSEGFMRATLEGTITAGGLCRAAAARGALTLDYFKDASIRYEMEFEAGGALYRFHGVKRGIRPWNLHKTHTTCYGTIVEVGSGVRLSDAVVFFPLSQLPRFIFSLRFG
jgi:hypothetical protein